MSSVWTAIVSGAAVVLLLDFTVRLIAARLVLPQFERRIPFFVDPSPPQLHAETVAFETTDGLTLRGSWYQSSSPRQSRGLVLFCPELGGSHWSALKYVGALHHSGFDVLSFDFRNQGESDSLAGNEPLHWVTEFELSDIQAALRFASRHPALQHLPLGIAGISRGGSAAILAATRNPEIQAVFSEGCYSTESLMLHYTLRWASLYVPSWVMRLFPIWHVRLTLLMTRWISQRRRRCVYPVTERHLVKLRSRPVLIVAGTRDTYVPPEISRRIQTGIGSPMAALMTVEGAKHNQSRVANPVEYDASLIGLFSRLGASESRADDDPQPTVATVA